MPFGAYDTTMGSPEGSLSVGDTGFFFGSAYTPLDVLSPGLDSFFSEGLNSLAFNFGETVAAPQTVGELVAAMSLSGASGLFRINPEMLGGGFDFVDVSFAAPAPIPLPASAPLVLLALSSFVALRRR